MRGRLKRWLRSRSEFNCIFYVIINTYSIIVCTIKLFCFDYYLPSEFWRGFIYA